MRDDDTHYYRHRANVETNLARKAQEPGAVIAHYQLARLYLERLRFTAPDIANSGPCRLSEDTVMTEQATAITLMRMALALLDRNGMTIAACHLEQALQKASDLNAVEGKGPDHDAQQTPRPCLVE